MPLSRTMLLACLLTATPGHHRTAPAPAAPYQHRSVTPLGVGPGTAVAWWLLQWGLRSDSAGGGSTSGGGWGGRIAWGAAAADLPANGGGGGGGVCLDSCPLARNGICEDGSNVIIGRSGPGGTAGSSGGLQVACDFGTDCTDCGPYKGVVPSWGTDAGYHGPIDFLSRQGFRVWARRVVVEPFFVFAYTDPTLDLDVSEQIERAGCMELGVLQVFRQVIRQHCGPFKLRCGDNQPDWDPAKAPLVVDVGANFGYYTLYAALLGCRVVAVEPVPRFLAFLHWSLAANGLLATAGGAGSGAVSGQRSKTPPQQPLVTVVDRLASTLSGANVTMAVPRRGVWGTASIAGMGSNMDQDLELLQVGSQRLDEIIGGEEVLLLKVDVEGYEPAVFRSAERLLGEHRADNILLEYSPGMPEIVQRLYPDVDPKEHPVQIVEPPQMLLGIIRSGYSVVQLPDNFAKSGYLPQLYDPMPPFQEVLESSVLYDIADVERFRSYSAPGSVCPWPPELAQINPGWGAGGCLRAPDDSHPKGLRVMFSYNTNLWASRRRSGVNVSGPVGLFGPGQDEDNTWWSATAPNQGVGNRACPYLPANQLVRSRCNCTRPEACGAEQDALLKALAEGRMPALPRLPVITAASGGDAGLG